MMIARALLLLLSIQSSVNAFAPLPTDSYKLLSQSSLHAEQIAAGVYKEILREGSGAVPQPNDTVEIEYTGRLASIEWSAKDVVDCWLSTQQGFDSSVADRFVEHDVTSTRLFDDSFFTETFVSESLGISNKIACKKLVMAARRLAGNAIEVDKVFDSSADRDKNYSFTLGAGKAIKAMDQAVATMSLGEECEITCRSDYAYGKDGLRTAKGDEVVPPFATLKFQCKLVAFD